MMRAMDRLVRRCRLPVRYSQGFNPRADISLVFPRPVGVATRDDLMVLVLDQDIEAAELLQRLNAACPVGLRMLHAEVLPDRAASRPRRIHYELTLSPAQAEAVRARIQRLDEADAWPIDRQRPPSRRGETTQTQPIDLKGLVAELHVSGPVLHMILQPKGDLWARPGEVLRLLGLDEQTDLSATSRTRMEVGA